MCMGLDSHNWELRMQINYWRVRKMIASDHQIYLFQMYDQNLIFRIVPIQYLSYIFVTEYLQAGSLTFKKPGQSK